MRLSFNWDSGIGTYRQRLCMRVMEPIGSTLELFLLQQQERLEQLTTEVGVVQGQLSHLRDQLVDGKRAFACKCDEDGWK